MGGNLHPILLKGYMDIKDIAELAKTHEEAILASKLTRNELVALLGLLQARIMARVYGDVGPREITPTTPSSKAPAPISDHLVEPVKPAKPVSYDPVYDPAPPFDIDKPPDRANASSRVLAQPNHACVCAACNKVSYTVNRLVKDGDKIDDFLKSFTPMAGIKPLTRKIEVMNVDGQISIDCPMCHSNKSLYLTGMPTHG